MYRSEFSVPDSAIDRNGHVNNVVFVQWMQEAAIKHFTSGGGMEASKAAGGTWVVRTHHVEYLSPGFAGDRIEVQTGIVNFSRVRSLRRFKFLRLSDGKLLVTGETDWVFVDVKTGRPCAIPESVKQGFSLWSG